MTQHVGPMSGLLDHPPPRSVHPCTLLQVYADGELLGRLDRSGSAVLELLARRRRAGAQAGRRAGASRQPALPVHHQRSTCQASLATTLDATPPATEAALQGSRSMALCHEPCCPGLPLMPCDAACCPVALQAGQGPSGMR